MKLTELIKSLNGSCNCPGLNDFEVSGITCNSGQVQGNFIFVAIKGSRQDGSAYIDEAIKRGAKAVILAGRQGCPASGDVSFIRVKDTRKVLAKLAARFYGNPSHKLKVIGVTGTNGKTTITYLLEALLKEACVSPAVVGTINCRFKERVFPSSNTTPGAAELQSMLSDMSKENIDYCIMEVSSHALDQHRTYAINFHSAIFTNLTQDHLDYHKTLGNYFQAKARLFEGLSPDAFAIINNDDKSAKRLKKITKAGVITYGIDKDADIRAQDIKFSVAHTEFLAQTPKEKICIKSGLIGRHNVYNMLAVIAWALEEGIGIPIIKRALEKFTLVPGRLERIDCKGGFSVFVDYAHTEDALKNIIGTLRQVSAKRIIVVFGCGGERDKTKRPKMGKVVTELSDYAIITNDNPRSEDPSGIINDIKRGINKNNYCVIEDRTEAIRKAMSLVEPSDVVLIAGKGHEEYQILKDKRTHFSDREVARECLRLMKY